MKKFIFLVWVLVFLGGCASEARVAVLEKQVAELEKQQASEKQAERQFQWHGEKGFFWRGGNFSWQ